MAQARRHHYISQFYLRNVAADGAAIEVVLDAAKAETSSAECSASRLASLLTSARADGFSITSCIRPRSRCGPCCLWHRIALAAKVLATNILSRPSEKTSDSDDC